MSQDPITISPPCPSKPGGEIPRPPVWLLAVIFLLALASTSAFLREPEKVDLFCREQFDVVAIVRAADAATPAAIARWWYGPWIQQEMPYYRPLTSMLFLTERRLFRDRWLLYSLVSWPLHAINTVLLAVLAYRLFSGSDRRRAALALFAAVLFTVPYWGNQGTAMKMLYWWPSQGEILSLGFSLAALLAWDRVAALPCAVRAASPRARSAPCVVIVSMVLMLLAILSKEMAYVLPGLMLLLSLYRQRHRAPRTAHRALVLLPFALAGLLWLLRRAFVPEAMGGKWKGLYSLQKLYHHLGGPLGPMVIVGDWALPVAAAGAAFLLWAFARRGHLPIGVALAGGWAALAFHWLGTSWARVLLAPNPWFLTRGVAYWFALLWLWRARSSQPVLFALGALFLIHLPLLHHGGVHYYYWPSAAWAIVNTVVVASLLDARRQ